MTEGAFGGSYTPDIIIYNYKPVFKFLWWCRVNDIVQDWKVPTEREEKFTVEVIHD